jgi:mannose-6-phosphate isomerase-like protein (cupin superfamily)
MNREGYARRMSESNDAVVRLGVLDGDTVTLDPHQGFTVPKGVVHRTRAPVRTAIVMVESAGVVPTGD